MSLLATGKNIETIIREEGTYASVTEGRSMRPLFKTHRDMVIIEKCASSPVKYDTVLYRVGQKYILHRIIGIDQSAEVYLIRGDNTFKTERIPFDKIIGIMTSFNRKGKRYSVLDKGYLGYVRIWTFIYPVRYVIYQPWRALRFFYRKLFQKKFRES